MAIYRGDGGAGDATNDITINQITELSSDAQAAATAAASSATSASSSASAASTSATNAANSATSAGTSATNAASSASSASTSASNASTSETNAAASETAAAASEAAAALSETAAAASESAAATSATNASASETAAASSASAASTSATNAATSASNASTSASNAATSESNAATSESNAATSETNAAASATAAAASAASAASSDYATSSWYTTTNNSSNWDTAYGWGDHASAGYLLADGAVVINESGANVDFRIESDTNANAFFLEGSNGNVGIGTTSPTSILHTRATNPVLTADGSAFSSSSNGTGFGIYRSASGRAAGYTWTIENAISGGGTSASDYQTDHLLFKGRVDVTDTTLTEHMRITNTGRVGIGTSSPQESLHTTGNIRFGDSAPAEIYTNSSELRLGVDKNNDNGASDITFYADNTERMRIDSSGNLTATGDVTAYSDERLKENWKDLPENFVANLAGVKSGTYNRIDLNGKQQVGVSAQSLQTVLPDAVIETNDTLTVNYGNAALSSAIELAKKVVELEARIKELEVK